MSGGLWRIEERATPGARHHFVLTPQRPAAGMHELTGEEEAGFFAALRCLVDGYEFDGYAWAVSAQVPLAVDVVVGDGCSRMRFDVGTGEVTAKRATP